MDESRRSVQPLKPAIRAFVTVIVALAILAILLWVAQQWGADRNLDTGFPLWVGAIAISIVVWAYIFYAGLLSNRGPGNLDRRSVRQVVASYVLFFAIAGSAVMFLLLLGSDDGGPNWSQEFRRLVLGVTLLAAAAASPWFVLIWTTHGRLGVLGDRISEITPPPLADDYDPRAVDAGGVRPAISELDNVWQAIERSSLAIGLLLSTAVIDTAFLRSARIASGASEDEFPPWTVVGYGAFFAIILVLILTPVLVRWRNDGMRLVERAVGEPRTGVPSESQDAARSRLRARVGIDRPGILRPVTLLGVLAPFLTGFFTSLIPS
ncbi:hypothetical protein [Agromyces sp. NPDC055661]